MTLKRHNFFQNENSGKAKRFFAVCYLIFKLSQELLKFSETCMSWNFQKNSWMINILNLENRRFENVSFSQSMFLIKTLH